VKAAFAGTAAKGCSQKTILDDSLNPIALGASLEPILVKLINVIGIAGRKDANIIADTSTLNRTVT